MSAMQADVYRGRNMGCMACGKPFAVVFPEPEPDPEPAAELSTTAPAFDEAQPRSAGPPIVAPPALLSGNSSAKTSVRIEVPSTSLLMERLALAGAILFVLFASMAAIVGAVASNEGGEVSFSRDAVISTLLWSAIASAGLAVALGLIALILARRLSPDVTLRSRRLFYCRCAMGLGGFELTLTGLLAILALAPLAQGHNETMRAVRLENLRQIGLAAASYASGRSDGKFPDALIDMVEAGDITSEESRCPGLARDASYTYLGKGMSLKAMSGRPVSMHTVLAYEPEIQTNGLGVLFADGAVIFVRREQAGIFLAELQAGKNPPPTALSLK